MGDWTVHWLEAAGDLSPWRSRIAAGIDAGCEAVDRVIPLPWMDILVQQLPGAVIPEIGMVGTAYRRSLFALSVDPANPRFETCIADGTLTRQIAHEIHHCLRMGGPGYGRSLGEALVSEGLAGRFTAHLFGTAPEPWEQAVDEAVLMHHLPDAAQLAATDYGHAAWFFGAGGRYPRWLGYTLGYRMAGAWLHRSPGIEGSAWVEVPAGEVLDAAAEAGLLRR